MYRTPVGRQFTFHKVLFFVCGPISLFGRLSFPTKQKNKHIMAKLNFHLLFWPSVLQRTHYGCPKPVHTLLSHMRWRTGFTKIPRVEIKTLVPPNIF